MVWALRRSGTCQVRRPGQGWQSSLHEAHFAHGRTVMAEQVWAQPQGPNLWQQEPFECDFSDVHRFLFI